MNDLESSELSVRSRNLGIGLILLYITVHLAPYFTGYRVPNWDLYKVMHVINHLQYPDLFAGERLSSFLAHTHTRTAPIYYYALAFPLSIAFPTKSVVLLIGFAITIVCGYLAGRDWRTNYDIVRALLVVVFLLHIYVTPLDGNRRSFTALFLLGLFWTERHDNYVWKLFLVAAAAGIYAPGALLCLAYLGLKKTRSCTQGSASPIKTILKLSGFSAVFLLVMTPYWASLLRKDRYSDVTDFVYSLNYELHSLGSTLRTFLGMGQEAFFREPLDFHLFFILLAIGVLEWVILMTDFRFQSRYGYLIGASLLCWGVAHLTHPLIYQPFKYTRVGLLIGVLLPVLDNLPGVVTRLNREFADHRYLRWIFYVLAGGTSLIWGVLTYYPSNQQLIEVLPVLTSHWWKFFLALPVFFVMSLVFPGRLSAELRSLIAGLALLLLILLPHNPVDDLGNLEGMLTVLQESKPGSVVAAPPGEPLGKILDTVPVFAKRPVYLSHSVGGLSLVCERTSKILDVYYDQSRQSLLQFMQKNNIDYFLMDRKLFQIASFTARPECYRKTQLTRNAFLNQHFPGAVWSYRKRLYLLTPEIIESHP